MEEKVGKTIAEHLNRFKLFSTSHQDSHKQKSLSESQTFLVTSFQVLQRRGGGGIL